MKYSEIFFDLDGTLTDPYEGITKSVVYALKKFGIEVNSRQELKCFIGPPLHESFMKYYGMTDKDADKAIVYYREYFSVEGLFENTVYRGIPALLCQLCDSGARLSVATSKPEIFAKRILDKFGLTKYFAFIAGSELSGQRVNKDEVIEYAISNLNISDRSSVIMVGDRLHDIAGAKKTQIDSAGVLWGYGSRKEHEEAGADYIAEDICELKQILLGEQK